MYDRPATLLQSEEKASNPIQKQECRDQLRKEVAQLEKKIASVEGELAELELSFQNPATGTDWESTHKRYADQKIILERLYGDLDNQGAGIDGVIAVR